MRPKELFKEKFNCDLEADREYLLSVDAVNQFFNQTREDFKKIADSINLYRTEWIKSKESLEVYRTIKSAEEKYEKLIEESEDIGAEMNITSYAERIEKKHNLEEEIKAFDDVDKAFENNNLLIKAQKHLIIEHRKNITKKREAFLEEMLKENTKLQIKIQQFGSLHFHDDAEFEIRKQLKLEKNTFASKISKVNNGLLAILYNQNDLESGIHSLKEEIRSLVLGQKKISDARLQTHFESLEYMIIDSFDTWFPEDGIEVSFNFRNEWKPIQNGSPGEKTAALLSFVLSTGNEPLILDQPEDDLDNKYISEIIVELLREAKKKRQIIIATHNANIVVNGDAENIIVLESGTKQTAIKEQDGLQNPKIRENVCIIMEGGQEAFKKRYKRVVLDC